MPFLLLMPSYNQAHYIGQAIESVLAQDDPDWELWIIDNSSDHTPKVVSAYADPRIHFHHIPKRMDPGTCLNWALQRAEGRDFSYIHTDNNLRSDYVRQMRVALAKDELALAYCDMRVIDDDGALTGVFRRGSFDLPRLFSLSPLGVPFSATAALAQNLGGFSTEDVADDVLFCTKASGLGTWTHLPEPLVDYRVHRGSRTEGHGGSAKMESAFLSSHTHALAYFSLKQQDVIGEIRTEIRRLLMDMDLAAEDAWYSRGHLFSEPKMVESPTLDPIWKSGLVNLEWFEREVTAATKSFQIKSPKIWWKWPSLQRKARRAFRPLEAAMQPLASSFRNLLIPWACLSLGVIDEPVQCWVSSPDVFTLWGAKLLSISRGWRVFIPLDRAQDFPGWLAWDRAPVPDRPSSLDVSLNLSLASSRTGNSGGLKELSLYSHV
jgi:glycosyltransferase involved in cell wall biosynthesis